MKCLASDNWPAILVIVRRAASGAAIAGIAAPQKSQLAMP
jgi:hypothetical protein